MDAVGREAWPAGGVGPRKPGAEGGLAAVRATARMRAEGRRRRLRAAPRPMGVAVSAKGGAVPSKYELHVVCGVNEFVDGPVNAFERTYRCSHINFLATQTAAAGMPPELFFAECRNDGSGVGLCCPVAMPLPGTEQVRCFYCECAGSRIVHPAAKEESFLGRDREFEKMLCGEEVYSVRHTNDDMISHSHYKTLWVDYLEEDQIYGNYICDNNIVEENFPRDDMW